MWGLYGPYQQCSIEVPTAPKILHYLDLEQCNSPDTMFTMKIKKNYEGHAKEEVKKATEARLFRK